MFKLYPSEELIIETEFDPTIKERKNSRYLLVIAAILVVVAVFYRFASDQDMILNAVFWASVAGIVISLIAYAYKLYKAGQKKGSLKYYLTSRRIVEVDKNNNINREMLKNKVKRVEFEKIISNAGDVIINPKPISPQEAAKQKRKKKEKSEYSKDTFVIKSIKNAKAFKKSLED